MTCVDTNILFHAIRAGSALHEGARRFLLEYKEDSEFVVAELILAELYQLIRNPVVMGRELSVKEAGECIGRFRANPHWKLVENAPVMTEVWRQASLTGFARRRLFDLRLALTLRHHGVTRFATMNEKDFRGLGFERVWNPLADK